MYVKNFNMKGDQDQGERSRLCFTKELTMILKTAN